jgi:hypothetical protein
MGYQLIETIEVGSGGAASIEFTGIPQDGVDLVVLASLRNTIGTDIRGINLYFNSDTGSNYSYLSLKGDGSAASSSNGTATALEVGWMPGATTTANTFGSAKIYISNYTSGTAKSTSSDAVTENNGTTAYASLFANSWSGTAAITSITIDSSGDIEEYSTASLYKITAD